jgi:hypothetical protein
MTEAPRVGSIGDLLRERRSLYLCCQNYRCTHSAKVDLPALVRERGASYPLQRALERARCLRCGARWPRVSLIAPPDNAGGFQRRTTRRPSPGPKEEAPPQRG